ncbi:MAG: S-layer homology domain-containing protein [Clostridia bacterium]|jgi:hypothetical protein|nr:S-layer homology domain-containing protein [Clostridia bacterium]
MKKIILALAIWSISILEGYCFSDMDDHWAKLEVEKGVSKGILNGYEDGTFKPEEKVTSAMVYTVLDRIFEKSEVYKDVDFVLSLDGVENSMVRLLESFESLDGLYEGNDQNIISEIKDHKNKDYRAYVTKDGLETIKNFKKYMKNDINKIQSLKQKEYVTKSEFIKDIEELEFSKAVLNVKGSINMGETKMDSENIKMMSKFTLLMELPKFENVIDEKLDKNHWAYNSYSRVAEFINDENDNLNKIARNGFDNNISREEVFYLINLSLRKLSETYESFTKVADLESYVAEKQMLTMKELSRLVENKIVTGETVNGNTTYKLDRDLKRAELVVLANRILKYDLENK